MEKNKGCQTCFHYFERNKKITRDLGVKGYCKKLNAYVGNGACCTRHWLNKNEGKEEQRILDKGW